MQTRLPRPTPRAGFTLVEVLVTLVVGSLVLGAVYKMLLSQNRTYGRQTEMSDVHNTLRSAGALLLAELRPAAASDLYTRGVNSIALRTARGAAIVCARHATLPVLGLVRLDGTITASDSALVFVAGTPSMDDDRWRTMQIAQSGSGAGMGVSACAWGNGITPELAVGLAVSDPADTAGLEVGGPITAFRRVEYGLYQENGRWWLGRKLDGAAAYEPLTGPLRSPTDGGLEFSYLDDAGNPTADPAQIAVVRFTLRGESHGAAKAGTTLQYLSDSLSIRVVLRG